MKRQGRIRYPIVKAVAGLGLAASSLALYRTLWPGPGHAALEEFRGRVPVAAAAAGPNEPALGIPLLGDSPAAGGPGLPGATEAELYMLDIEDIPSPNYNDANDREIKYIVFHTTEGSSFDSDIKELTSPGTRKSAHYLVGRDGRIARLVADEDMAWGITGQNGNKLHIEMQGTYAEPVTGRQLEISGQLAFRKMAEYGIPMENVLPHSYFCEKLDPGRANMEMIHEYIRSLGGGRIGDRGKIPEMGEYIVQPGDSISKIAASNKGISSSRLGELNGLDEDSIIQPGDVLKIVRYR